MSMRIGIIVAMVAAAPASAQIGVLTNFEGGQVGKVETVSPAHLRCAVPGQADCERRLSE